ncbi:MAG: hypothetical protein RIS47_395 [Bacteroidota bacterium]|jgi:tRNA dimethylallyltransferase
MAKLIAIIGPTASGKTQLATRLAHRIDAEIISADSRQVYRGMDIGTGKDLGEYVVAGSQIPVHLVDIVEAGTKYNLFEFQKDFTKCWADFESRGKQAILCGGSGLYVDAVTKGYSLAQVPYDEDFRANFAHWPMPDLVERLLAYGPLHNKTDIEDHKRLLRAIEIAEYQRKHPLERLEMPQFETVFIGVDIDRNLRRGRITDRLKERLRCGLIEEVQGLLDRGISPSDLVYYGLEYKFVTQHLLGELNYNDMYQSLNSAIHQFAKRQMTWFRKMEKEGTLINWLPFSADVDAVVDAALAILSRHNI